MDNLVEEITHIIQNKLECQTNWNMIYNISAVHVKLLKLKGNTSWKLLPKKGFLKTLKENIQL